MKRPNGKLRIALLSMLVAAGAAAGLKSATLLGATAPGHPTLLALPVQR